MTSKNPRPPTSEAAIQRHKMSEGQRNARDFQNSIKRVRHPSEAASVTICAGTTRDTYRTGQGEVFQPLRAGAMDAYQRPSRGLEPPQGGLQ